MGVESFVIMQAGFLRVKLPYLDKWNMERNRIAKLYLSKIQNPFVKSPLPTDEEHYCVWHIYPLMSDYREQLAAYLKEKGITTLIHYPIPMHVQGAYAELSIREGELPIAEHISHNELSIPLYYGMTEEEVQYVIDTINEFHIS